MISATNFSLNHRPSYAFCNPLRVSPQLAEKLEMRQPIRIAEIKYFAEQESMSTNRDVGFTPDYVSLTEF